MHRTGRVKNESQSTTQIIKNRKQYFQLFLDRLRYQVLSTHFLRARSSAQANFHAQKIASMNQICPGLFKEYCLSTLLVS